MITCAVTTSFLGCLATGLLFIRYVGLSGMAAGHKAALFVLFMMAGCIPLFVSDGLENMLGAFYPFYRYALYFIYIGCIILLVLTLFRDALWSAGYGLSRLTGHGIAVSPLSPAWAAKANALTAAAAVLLTIAALYSGTKTPDVKTIRIVSDKITQSRTIAVLSDLHIHRVLSADKIRKIVERTNAQNPDVILLAGDIMDDDIVRTAGMTELLKGLKAKEGIYFVTGNHEFYAGYRESIDALKSLGFTFLENSGLPIGEDVYLAGIPDFTSFRAFGLKIDLPEAFAGASDGRFRLLVSHTPADFGKENNFDLEVSGHTHGGQIFPFHIFAKWHNRYLAGLYPMENGARIYVSRGAGQWGPQMRFLAPSEITVLRLEPGKEKN